MNQYAVVVDLGGTNFRIALVDGDFRVSHYKKSATAGLPTPEDVILAISDYVRQMNDSFEDSNTMITGLGVAAPGPLNAREGLVHSMPNLPGWTAFPLKDRLSDATGLHTEIINDADAIALGEMIRGAAIGLSTFIQLTLGTGLGSSVILDGSPLIGSEGVSPELGHIPVFDSDVKCGCGRMGHAETILSAAGLINTYRSTSEDETPLTGEVLDLFRRDKEGDDGAVKAVDRYARGLGRLIAISAIAYSCKDFVISGGISGSWSRLASLALAEIQQYGFLPLTDAIQIRCGKLGDKAGLIGCAEMVFNSPRNRE